MIDRLRQPLDQTVKTFVMKLMENLQLQGDNEFNRIYVERIIADIQDHSMNLILLICKTNILKMCFG